MELTANSSRLEDYRDLVGKRTRTIIIDGSCRIMAFKHQLLDLETARRVWQVPFVREELRLAHDGQEIFQSSQAAGTGLKDRSGHIY